MIGAINGVSSKMRQYGVIFMFSTAIFGSFYNMDHAKKEWEWMNNSPNDVAGKSNASRH
jgi:hypothetical protein